jgi:hypothetical protein
MDLRYRIEIPSCREFWSSCIAGSKRVRMAIDMGESRGTCVHMYPSRIQR